MSSMSSRRSSTNSTHDGDLANADLECPVCLRILQVPKVLSCGHTFCANCIDSRLKKLSHVHHPPVAVVECPLCRAESSEPQAGFPTNYFAITFIANRKLPPPTGPPSPFSCESCGRDESDGGQRAEKVWVCGREECKMPVLCPDCALQGHNAHPLHTLKALLSTSQPSTRKKTELTTLVKTEETKAARLEEKVAGMETKLKLNKAVFKSRVTKLSHIIKFNKETLEAIKTELKEVKVGAGTKKATEKAWVSARNRELALAHCHRQLKEIATSQDQMIDKMEGFVEARDLANEAVAVAEKKLKDL